MYIYNTVHFTLQLISTGLVYNLLELTPSAAHPNDQTNPEKEFTIKRGNSIPVRNNQQQRFGPYPKRHPLKSSLYSSRNSKANDHAIINGELYETNRVFVQKSLSIGTGYFAYGFLQTPVYVRTQAELNKKYVVFQDPYLPPGEGYFVLMKKIPHKAVFPVKTFTASAQALLPEIAYEAYHLLLGNNIQGTINRLNVERLAYDIRTNFYTKQRSRMNWIGKKQGAHSIHGQRFMMGGQQGVLGKSFSGSGLGWRGKRNVYDDDYNSNNSLKTTPCKLSPLIVSNVRLLLQEVQGTKNMTDRVEEASNNFQQFM